MTGEITLRGRVLPIGGLKEKVLAAHRAGMKRVIAPAENRRDLLELPRNVRRDLEFIWVEDMDQVLEAILIGRIAGRRGRPRGEPGAGPGEAPAAGDRSRRSETRRARGSPSPASSPRRRRPPRRGDTRGATAPLLAGRRSPIVCPPGQPG